jgi:hypothetical protein
MVARPVIVQEPPLKAATKQRLVETVADWEHLSVCDSMLWIALTNCVCNKSALTTQIPFTVTPSRDNMDNKTAIM